jgi:hypothetical protein
MNEKGFKPSSGIALSGKNFARRLANHQNRTLQQPSPVPHQTCALGPALTGTRDDANIENEFATITIYREPLMRSNLNRRNVSVV